MGTYGLAPSLCVMGRGLDVLIVDDDEEVADTIAHGVRLAGYRVCGIAPTADRALELARDGRPDIAIIDIDLGADRDGLEVARSLLAMGSIGVMFVTGYPERIERSDVGHAWLAKPYRVLDLINGLDVVRSASQGVSPDAPVPPELHILH